MIYYFSGTGNSRFIAQEIAALTNDCVCSMSEKEPIPTDENSAFLGIVFPVYGWQPPKIVRRFCATLDAASAKGRFVYIIMTCGTDCGKTLKILRRLMLLRIHVGKGRNVDDGAPAEVLPVARKDEQRAEGVGVEEELQPVHVAAELYAELV